MGMKVNPQWKITGASKTKSVCRLVSVRIDDQTADWLVKLRSTHYPQPWRLVGRMLPPRQAISELSVAALTKRPSGALHDLHEPSGPAQARNCWMSSTWPRSLPGDLRTAGPRGQNMMRMVRQILQSALAAVALFAVLPSAFCAETNTVHNFATSGRRKSRP